MKIARIILGIITIISSQLIAYQSQLVSYVETFANSLNDVFSDADAVLINSGAIGLLFAYFILCAGVISVSTLHNKLGSGIDAFIFLVAGIIAVAVPTIFTDLFIYGIISIILAIIYAIIFILEYKKENQERLKENRNIKNWL